jgi:hypothetical protein
LSILVCNTPRPANPSILNAPRRDVAVLSGETTIEVTQRIFDGQARILDVMRAACHCIWQLTKHCLTTGGGLTDDFFCRHHELGAGAA